MQRIKTCTAVLALLSLLLVTASFAASPEMNPNYHRATKLIGADVENSQGENLGDITDVVLDRTGRIEYAVLSFGGFLGLGEKYFAVPWAALRAEAGQRPGDRERYILNMDKERLKNAPGFDKNNWPDMADRSWAAQIYAFYGVPPSWEQRETRKPESITGPQGMPGNAIVAATVQNVDQNARLLTLKTTNNEVVELQAPAGMLNTLQAGDPVEVVIRKHSVAQPPAAGQPRQ
jgi:sporulation protein YlmC with PRC-barrel domain